MELTVDQALQQGIAAHKEGKLQEAERLYRAILQAQPKHPDANHNLGVLAVAVGKPLEALPLFKQAMDGNPQIEQFWLSYIDALIKVERFDEAKCALVEGEEAGLSSDKLDALKTRLSGRATIDTNKTAKGLTLSEKRKKLAETKKSKKIKARSSSPSAEPSQDQINRILVHYQANRLEEVEDLVTLLTQQFPKHPFGWEALGAVLRRMGRLNESLLPMQESADLSPQDAEAHYNLANTLKDLGRLDEAEAGYRKAIALKSDYAEAHNNLGAALYELGRLEEAETSYRHAIALNPDYAAAHNNLGLTLKKLHRYQEAISHFALTDDPMAIPNSLECLYIAGNYESLHERLHELAKSEDINIGVAAVSAFVSHQLKTQDPYQFCKKPLDYISVSNMREFEQDADRIINEILTEADTYQLRWESRTTKFGFQGPGDIFVNPSSAVSNLERIIGKALTKYYDNHKGASERFITAWPTSYKLLGWFNRLLKNGYQIAHIHPTGWLSGVIYLKTTPTSNNNAGAIEFSLHGNELPMIDENIPRQIHNPEEGDIVLFPSSLFHKTIPFLTDTERCVIAFDVQPAVDPA